MDTVTSRDGTTIAFDRSGEGAAVILVGGAFQHRAFDPRTGQLGEVLAQAVYRVQLRPPRARRALTLRRTRSNASSRISRR